MQLLAGLDWPRLAALPPKWLCGFSDVSTLAVPLTLRAGWATLHSPNVFDISHPDRHGEMQALWHSWQHGLPPRQQAFTHFWPFGDPGVAKSSRVRVAGTAQASISGRLIGGCLDTLSRLAATPYFDLQTWRGQPVLLYLENCELAPCELARALTAMRLAGIFDGLAGLILGRSSGPEAQQAHELHYEEAVMQALDGLPCPLVLDADIGHVPPQWTLMNGAWATLHVQHGHATLAQHYHPRHHRRRYTMKPRIAPPSAAFVGVSWLALFAGMLTYLVGLWNATMPLNEKGYYFTVLLYGLFAAVSLQKTVRDRLENIAVSGIYYGLCWLSVGISLLLLGVGLWNATLLGSEKGFYAMAYLLSLFAAVAVQKNTRDQLASQPEPGSFVPEHEGEQS